MDITDALNAVENEGDAAARLAWPIEKYIDLIGGVVTLCGGTVQTAYQASPEDTGANDWIKGGDRPPKRP